MDHVSKQTVDALTARATALEEIVMHQDHVIQQLHESVLQQDRRLAAMEAVQARMAVKLQMLSDSLSGQSPPDEKPPHY